MFGLLKGGRQRTSTAKTGQGSDQAFQQMEQRISRIHYYRKLMELDYFTPQAAKELMRQWNQGA